MRARDATTFLRAALAPATGNSVPPQRPVTARPTRRGVPSISLCLIARNEEDALPGCLESVRGVVDEMIVVDTGS
jgi:hypothetical protein